MQVPLLPLPLQALIPMPLPLPPLLRLLLPPPLLMLLLRGHLGPKRGDRVRGAAEAAGGKAGPDQRHGQHVHVVRGRQGRLFHLHLHSLHHYSLPRRAARAHACACALRIRDGLRGASRGGGLQGPCLERWGRLLRCPAC